MLEVASALRAEINYGLAILRDIASGKEWNKLLGVCWFLTFSYLISLMPELLIAFSTKMRILHNICLKTLFFLRLLLVWGFCQLWGAVAIF